MVVVANQVAFVVQGFWFRSTSVLFTEPEKGGFYGVV
jgi:hypothetical protein